METIFLYQHTRVIETIYVVDVFKTFSVSGKVHIERCL